LAATRQHAPVFITMDRKLTLTFDPCIALTKPFSLGRIVSPFHRFRTPHAQGQTSMLSCFLRSSILQVWRRWHDGLTSG
jgi:hypothetical protein